MVKLKKNEKYILKGIFTKFDIKSKNRPYNSYDKILKNVAIVDAIKNIKQCNGKG